MPVFVHLLQFFSFPPPPNNENVLGVESSIEILIKVLKRLASRDDKQGKCGEGGKLNTSPFIVLSSFQSNLLRWKLGKATFSAAFTCVGDKSEEKDDESNNRE